MHRYAPSWGIGRLKSVAEYGGKMTDAAEALRATGRCSSPEFAGFSGISA